MSENLNKKKDDGTQKAVWAVYAIGSILGLIYAGYLLNELPYLALILVVCCVGINMFCMDEYRKNKGLKI